MLALTLDTSSAAVIAAIVEIDGGAPQLRACSVTFDARKHGELLAPAINDVLRHISHRPRDLSAIVCGLGPGPFTGLRVGLVTATSLADALTIPTYGVCSLDAIAGATDVRPLLVATDARRQEVYWAIYDERSRRVAGPNVSRPHEVVPRLPEFGVVAAAGAGALQYRDLWHCPVLQQQYPDPVALAELARDRISDAAATEQLRPLYLRRPDATPAKHKAALLQ